MKIMYCIGNQSGILDFENFVLVELTNLLDIVDHYEKWLVQNVDYSKERWEIQVIVVVFWYKFFNV